MLYAAKVFQIARCAQRAVELVACQAVLSRAAALTAACTDRWQMLNGLRSSNLSGPEVEEEHNHHEDDYDVHGSLREARLVSMDLMRRKAAPTVSSIPAHCSTLRYSPSIHPETITTIGVSP